MSGERREWNTQDFDFVLPPELIAQRPSEHRGGSRLMTLYAEGRPLFSSFEEIVGQFRGDEVLVLNDTKVVPARLFGHKASGGKVEVFFLEQCGHQQILAMTRGRVKPGNVVALPLGVNAELIERDDHGRALFQLTIPEYFTTSGDDEGAIWAWLEEAGKLPLPPYITREPDQDDYDRYQTIFAKSPGAVAAPTAGLHLTEDLLNALKAKGVTIAYVTLHVGPGTFLPVKSESIADHVMHSERYSVPRETQELIRSDRPVIAVGTTVVRALESFASFIDSHPQMWGEDVLHETDIFITPGYQWRIVDGLITNFHLPQSTLLMLVSALAGYERVRSAYEAAIKERLRFYSYGDASLFWRPNSRWTSTSR